MMIIGWIWTAVNHFSIIAAAIIFRMWFDYLVWSWIFLAIFIFSFLVITKIRAPYGRHVTEGWGKMISNKWGWFMMEIPALVIFPVLLFIGPNAMNTCSWLLLIMWVVHYSYRTLIFPFKIKTEGKQMPLLIMLSAILFNGMNGFINGYFMGFLADQNNLNWNVIIGIVVFLIGLIINRKSDNYLINLRRENKGYFIPKGMLFNKISCPNHFGEILQWIGFTLVAWSLPALSFAIWTMCNLIPRALNHHKWYRDKFDNYPKNRKAVIPYLL